MGIFLCESNITNITFDLIHSYVFKDKIGNNSKVLLAQLWFEFADVIANGKINTSKRTWYFNLAKTLLFERTKWSNQFVQIRDPENMNDPKAFKQTATPIIFFYCQ